MASEGSVDISQILTSLGVPEEKATNLQNQMNGVDYLNLVNAVGNNTAAGRQQASAILAKYGIKLRKDPQMENYRLDQLYSAIHSGKSLAEAEESLTQYVRPISEMDTSISAMLEASGFSSYVRALNDDDADALQEWLDENEINYQNNDRHTFLVQGSDRDQVYRLNHYMSNKNGKTSMMDADGDLSAHLFKGKKGEVIATKFGRLKVIGSKEVKKHDGNKDFVVIGVDKAGNQHEIQVDTANAGLYGSGGKHDFEEAKMAKTPKNIPASTPRNPVAQGIVKKSGGGVHANKDAKRDPFDRRAKHKKTLGESAARVDEGVLGMTKVDPLYRLRELAGMRAGKAINFAEDDVADLDAPIEVADDFDTPLGGSNAAAGNDSGYDSMDGGMGDDIGGGDMGDDFGSDMDFGADDAAGFDDELGMDSAPDMGGMPGDLPPAGDIGGSVGVVPVNSEAYGQILDHLNNIQTSLGDVKLSEYKSLIAKLDALGMQVKSMGRDYLGEMRKLKK